MRRIILGFGLVCSIFSFSALAQEKTVPPGAKIYIEAPDGFDTYLAAALEKKHVPVTVVTTKESADYELSGVSDQQKPGWAKVALMGQIHSDDQASVKLVNLKNGGGRLRICSEKKEYFARSTDGGRSLCEASEGSDRKELARCARLCARRLTLAQSTLHSPIV